MTGCMLTSLNVVRMAAVDWDSTSLCATRWRRRDIGTRCSGRSPRTRSTFTGAGGNGGLTAGLRNTVATSSLVTRPPLPLPVICDVSRLLSAAIFFAAGMTAGCAAAAGSSLEAAGAAAAGVRATTSAGAFASGSIVAMNSLLVTVPPSPLITLLSTPDAGAGNSSTTLSVSMSIRFSSRLTNSPAFLCHDSNVASATDSESAGIFTSTSMADSLLLQRRLWQTSDAVRQGSVHYRLLSLVVQSQVAAGRRG